MSADNYIGIWKGDDGRYRGYMLFASDDVPKQEPVKKRILFDAANAEEAMRKAMTEEKENYYEYGISFIRA